jgi:hypothetical protein
MSRQRSISATVLLASGPPSGMPALLNITSIRPPLALAQSASATSHAARSRTSRVWIELCPEGSSAAVSRIPASLMSAMPTNQPSAANFCATARPMPEAPPVMKMHLRAIVASPLFTVMSAAFYSAALL